MLLLPQLREDSRRGLRRARGWMIPAALLVVAPKCVACLLAYAGVGAMLGLGGPELCGATDRVTWHWETWLALTGIAGAIGMFTFRSFRAPRDDSE